VAVFRMKMVVDVAMHQRWFAEIVESGYTGLNGRELFSQDSRSQDGELTGAASPRGFRRGEI